MATKASIAKMKYDKTHIKQYPLRMNLVYDADIIDKLSSVSNVQGYIRQLIREDIARTRTEFAPVSEPADESVILFSGYTKSNKAADIILENNHVYIVYTDTNTKRLWNSEYYTEDNYETIRFSFEQEGFRIM